MAKRSLVRKILTFTLAVLVMLPAAVIPKNEAFADERRGIYYYNDGGVGAPPNDLYYQWGTWARVSERVPTWPGGEKVFKYWVDRHPDGMGSRGYYNPGDSIFMDDHRYLHPVWGDAASKQITITYHPNGGVGSIVTETISSGTNYTIKDQGYTRAGYTFDGWAIGTDGSGGNFAVGVTVRFDTNVTLYAKWKAVTTPTAVTYNPNGGNGSIVTVPVNKNSNYLVASQGYTRSGYTFDGYNSNAAGTGTNYSVGQYIFVTESITLYAKWKQDPIQQYTVTYYPNGGTGSSVSVNVNAGSNHTIVSQGYTRSGYSFDGYNSNSAGTGTNYSVGQSITVTGNVTLYAKWKQVQYTVTYNPNGGTGNINTINVNANTYHTVVSQGYTRPGYTFDGWNTNAAGTGTNYANGNQIYMTGNITLYAKWKQDPQLTVTYYPNGGTGSSNTVNVNAYTIYTIANQGYTRPGYTFDGWNTNAAGTGTNYANGDLVYITANLTLYAKWKQNPIQQYTVTYNPNGGTGNINTINVNANTYHTVVSQGYTRPGYTFDGWNTNAAGTGTNYANGNQIYMTGNITLYAKWKQDPIQQYTVTYHPNGGTGNSFTATVNENTIYTIISQGYTRDGYTFDGWNTQANGSGIDYSNGQQIYVTGNVTLYAKWKQNPVQQYAVVYYPNGGTGSVVADYPNGGTNYTIRANPFTRTDYTFDGWNTSPDGNGTDYSVGQSVVITGPMVLYAKWKAVQVIQYTVTYNPNGGVGNINSFTVNQGTLHIVANQGYTRSGYTFDGWNTNAAGTGTNYSDGQQLYVIANVTLYAKWKEIPITQYTITYYPNNGNGNVVVDRVNENARYTITSQSYTRTGYTFVGWNTMANGSGTAYTVGQQITVTANLALYAQWEQNPPTQYTVTYNPNGGTGSVNTVTVNENTIYTVVSQGYSRGGYTFDGWNTMANGSGIDYSNGSQIYITGNITLYAKWRQNPIQQVAVCYYPNGAPGLIVADYPNTGATYTIRGNQFTYSGYTFEGWNLSPAGTGTAYSAGQVITIESPMYLYAQWKLIPITQYAVTYNPNGGDGAVASDTVNANASYTIVSQGYTRTGYTFEGWNTNTSGTGTDYAVGQVITATGNLTLYAKWKEIPITQYTVTYYPNGGTGSQVSDTVNDGSIYLVVNQGFTRTGHTFAGWNTNAAGTGTNYVAGDSITISGNVALYAKWTENPPTQHTVTYYPNLGTGNTKIDTVNENTLYTVVNQGYTRSGYTFNGWNTASNGSGDGYADGDQIMITANIALYARWKEIPVITYIVTYNPNGGSGSVVSYSGADGSAHTVIDPGFSRTNFSMAGFNTMPDGSGTQYALGQSFTLNSNVTLYAQWKAVANYMLVYNPNGGIGSMAFDTTNQYGEITVVDKGYTRSGYTFDGYNSAFDGSGTQYSVGQELTLTDNLFIHAQWKLIVTQSVTVTYNANGGTGFYQDVVSGPPDISSPAFGNAYFYTIQNPNSIGISRQGYIFVCWSDRTNSGGITYSKGESTLISADEDLVLYAIWEVDTQQ